MKDKDTASLIQQKAMDLLGGHEAMQKTLREEIRKGFLRYRDGLSAEQQSSINNTLESSQPLRQDFYESVAFAFHLNINEVFRVPQDQAIRQEFIELLIENAVEIPPNIFFDVFVCSLALEGMDNSH